jgi:5-methylcytosine-specific restriction enzyme subunit McrC
MGPTTEVLELEEGTPARVPASSLPDARLQALLRLKWLGLQPVIVPDRGLSYELLATNVCGQVFVGDDFLLRVRTKVAVGNLFRMLELVYKLRSFEFGEGLVDIEALADLYERLASILARRVMDRARRGLYRDYVNEQSVLGFVRGRLDLRQSSRLLAAGAAAVHCEFQDHTSDISENQILAWTLDALSRAALQREEVRLLVRQARRTVVGAVSLRPVLPVECKRRRYSRLNDDYRPLHGLCRFFLESLGPGLERGAREVMPYTVNMAQLFESYVAEWLTRHGPSALHFGVQHALRLVGTSSIEWNVDILVRDSATHSPVAVLDTKYKSVGTPGASDIQQVVSYAVETGVQRAFLVYPTKNIDPFQVKVGNVIVRSVGFDIGGDLEAAGQEFLSQICLS